MTDEHIIIDQAIETETLDAMVDLYAAARTLVRPRLRTRIQNLPPNALVAQGGRADQWFSDEEWRSLVEENASQAQGDVVLDGIVAAMLVFGVIVPDRDVRRATTDRSAWLADGASHVRGRLDEWFTTGVNEGWSPLQFDESFDADGPLGVTIAELVARTEWSGAANNGVTAGMIAASAVALSEPPIGQPPTEVPFTPVGRRWQTALDARVRPAHVVMEGVVVPVGQPFTLISARDGLPYQAMYPGDWRLPPDLVWNCRCVASYVSIDGRERTIEATTAELRDEAAESNVNPVQSKPDLQADLLAARGLQTQDGGTSDDPRDWNRVALLTAARQGNVDGRYQMSRDALVEAVLALGRFTGFALRPWSFSLRPDVIEQASRSLIAGEAVTVDAEDVVLVVDGLAEEMEPVDLTLLTVDSEPFFAAVRENTLARDQMPQVSVELLDDFRLDLFSRGILSHYRDVDPLSLWATQNELDGRKVAQMARAIGLDRLDPATVPIVVSADSRLLDGHHRWAAEVVLAHDEARTSFVLQVETPIGMLLPLAHTFARLHGVERKSTGMSLSPHVVQSGA